MCIRDSPGLERIVDRELVTCSAVEGDGLLAHACSFGDNSRRMVPRGGPLGCPGSAGLAGSGASRAPGTRTPALADRRPIASPPAGCPLLSLIHISEPTRPY